MLRTVLKSIMQFLLLLASVVALASANPRLDGRIIGGKNVTIEEYPYQISLRRWDMHNCGGSIINKDWILTAAHCTYGSPLSKLAVRVGSTMVEDGEEIKVEQTFQHPQYNPENADYDICLLKLSKSLTFSDSVQPIKYATQRPPDGAKVVVSGWGIVREGWFMPDILQAVEVNIINQDKCVDLYKGYEITGNMICAGVEEGGKDACQGDSGGPLVYNGELVGVVSWGYRCARPQYPGVYANVAELSGFIDKTLAENS